MVYSRLKFLHLLGINLVLSAEGTIKFAFITKDSPSGIGDAINLASMAQDLQIFNSYYSAALTKASQMCKAYE